ncbi:hypothetical protein ACFP1I_13160 [Dyadobacter subterraneus]|uniref:Uncharacterized protein n=1 Tax=Dyadobacter subterraneus TaxID=2773304 RepID=A0ABR9WB24_9BACT|nr:hypothetical protein [Dyadobacter subterraneus]MBE9462181.1 hypothetical protein [Dyadobacter subterraneus]
MVSDTMFLKWNLKNSTDSNLIVPTLFTFRRLDGEDHKAYTFKEDTPIGLMKIVTVPYRYLRQIPDFKLDYSLHTQAKNIHNGLSLETFVENFYQYITNRKDCPQIIFLKAHSEKQLIFIFKQGIKGKYRCGYESKGSVDKRDLPIWGDSLVKRGVPLFQQQIGHHIKTYTFEYGKFDDDSIEIDLNI